MLKALILAAAVATAPENPSPTHPNEEAVDPYAQSNENAGAKPFEGAEMLKAFNGREGIDRIVDTMIELNVKDPVIGDFFRATDLVRLRRTLKEQFCYILNGGCDYTGRDMRASHKDQGAQNADFNRLVENLQKAMDKEGVPFRAQNRFLAKLAPMQRTTVER